MHSGFAALRKKGKKGIPRKEGKKEADKPGKNAACQLHLLDTIPTTRAHWGLTP